MSIDKTIKTANQPLTSVISFSLDSQSGVPTYLQLVQQVEAALSLGYLVEGDQLPTVKDVVSSIAINPNTVLKAYRELESRGIAEGRPGVGTFVIASPPVLLEKSPTELFRVRLVQLTVVAAVAEVDDEAEKEPDDEANLGGQRQAGD